MTAVTDRRVTVWQKKINPNIKVAGSGSPVVFLHGAGGLVWDEFLDRLAERHRVYAPEHPGTTEGDPEAISHIDNLWDLVLYYYEVFDALGLKSVPIVGHSFGAMVAAELAASNPERVSKLVLIAPIGLWREDTPIVNWMIITPGSDLPKYLLRDPDGPIAKQMFGTPDPEGMIRMIWSMGCTGKFVWPIPDKGLKKRIHRIQAPTLLLWGKQDRLVPAVYAQEFASRIPGSRVELIEESGHLPTVEHPAKVAASVEEFFAGQH
ncbi:MAG TPA: alpha/beta hydrolase [Bryobacteraceae bacterium]|jgi:pimeloyl-ACP methyl ester carboxylesterase|nr:alpha/beta hydrolase [Bryobacteraceae bacterium]